MPFNYELFKSYADATFALEDYYASGIIAPGEHPRIERQGKLWAIVVEGLS